MATRADIAYEVKRITNDLRIATSMATLKREQSERAEERVTDLGQQLQEAISRLESHGLEPVALDASAAAEQGSE